MNPDPANYLGPCDVIDFGATNVGQLAARLADDDPVRTAERCFCFVRDQIKHSADFQLNPVTCRASDVLTHGTGYCYAKSHLLCALLRANGIPAGLCYQRLSSDDAGSSFCLHGLNAVHLPDYGWYRVDARGNRQNIQGRFEPPVEHLAFSTSLSGEYDLPGIHAVPLPVVVEALRKFDKWDELQENLPDVPNGT